MTQPKATLLLVTYNQQRFIREAFNAALAQDYQPLQIIVADDGSSDDTTRIVRELVEAYTGPHSILIVDGLPNLGLFGNIQRGVKHATGDLIVIGAGDDVPFSNRVSTMVSAWRATGAVSLHSQYDVIDDNGQRQERGVSSEAPGHVLWSLFHDKQDRMFVGGATAAYSRTFLASFPETPRRIFHEDSMLTLAAHATGQIVSFVPVATLAYRVHDASYSNQAFTQRSAREITVAEEAYIKFAKDTVQYLQYLREDWFPRQSFDPDVTTRIDFKAYTRREKTLSCTINALSPNLATRVSNLTACTRLDQLLAALVRLPGLTAFATLKSAVLRARKRA